MSDWFGFLVAFALSVLLVPLADLVAKKREIVSKVTADRWHQSGAVPRLGGAGFILPLILFTPMAFWPALGTSFLIGLIDDVTRMKASHKALLLFLPAVLGYWATEQWWVVPAIWFVANAVNLLDHADGLAASAAAVGFAGLGGIMGLAGAGVCMGFLVYNWAPAKTFMGDSGSLLLGTALVLLAADRQLSPMGLAWVAVPLIDAVFVTVRRMIEGRKPWVGGTDHTGHICLRFGVPAPLLPLVYAVLAGSLGVGLTTL